MNYLVYGMLILCFTVDFAAQTFTFVPRLVTWTPELASGVLLLGLIGHLGARRIEIPGKYVIWGLFMTLVIVAGILLNQVQPGAVFAGARKYFRYVPIFILPIVYRFSDAELKGQLKVLLALMLVQLPVAGFQRVVLFAQTNSGDVVEGTVMGSGHLSVILICAIAFLTTLYARGRLSVVQYALLAGLCFIPTTINETTATLFLLPIALAVPFVLAIGAGARFARMVPLATIGVGLVAAFTITYAAQFDRWGGDVTGVLRGEGLEFLYRGADSDSRADMGKGMSEIGRWDSIMMPFIQIDDPTKLLLGVGIGNANSTFNELLEGQYSDDVEAFGIDYTTISTLLWETGLLGVAMSCLFFYMIFSDALQMRKDPGLTGDLAVAVASIALILGATMLYTGIIGHNAVGFSMWLLFGHLVGRRLAAPVPLDLEQPGTRSGTPTYAAEAASPPEPRPPEPRGRSARPSGGRGANALRWLTR